MLQRLVLPKRSTRLGAVLFDQPLACDIVSDTLPQSDGGIWVTLRSGRRGVIRLGEVAERASCDPHRLPAVPAAHRRRMDRLLAEHGPDMSMPDLLRLAGCRAGADHKTQFYTHRLTLRA
jgi:hypothetical protein